MHTLDYSFPKILLRAVLAQGNKITSLLIKKADLLSLTIAEVYSPSSVIL
jgi:hypothetical protein